MSCAVRIHPSEQTFTVDDGESVLDAALRAGIQLPHSCRSGVCRTCQATILSGEIIYPEGQPVALDEAAQEQGFALLCQARPVTDLEIAAEPVGASGPSLQKLPARVQEVENLAPDVRRVRLKLPAGKRVDYRPGQYLDVLLTGNRRRSFSMANDPAAPESWTEDGAQLLELHIRHVPGGRFTSHVFEELAPGPVWRIEAPVGQFTLQTDSGRPAIFVAGGTGFGPVKAIIESMLADGEEPARPIHLYWGARDAAGLYLDGLARSWADRFERVHYTPALSEAAPADWDGRSGWVHDAVLEDFESLSGTEVYMAGPPPMIEAAKAAFIGRGLTPERLFYDSFEYSSE